MQTREAAWTAYRRICCGVDSVQSKVSLASHSPKSSTWSRKLNKTSGMGTNFSVSIVFFVLFFFRDKLDVNLQVASFVSHRHGHASSLGGCFSPASKNWEYPRLSLTSEQERNLSSSSARVFNLPTACAVRSGRDDVQEQSRDWALRRLHHLRKL